MERGRAGLSRDGSLTGVPGVSARLRDWLSLIRFSHSIFALPFALMALLVATGGRPSGRVLALVVAAMIAARSAAMAYNRWADREVDARNPRTIAREIPRGALGARAVLGFAIGCALAFVGIAWLLGPACFWLSLPTIAVLFGYSHAKRFTSSAHLWLGLALGLAPPAAWLAARGSFDSGSAAALLLGAGVSVWVAGFDVIYACQDEDFDRRQGLHSLPVRFGTATALRIAQSLHVVATAAFAGFGLLAGLGVWYYLGLSLVVVLLLIEHRLVAPGDLSRIDAAFFTMNGAVGLAMLAFTAIDVYLA